MVTVLDERIQKIADYYGYDSQSERCIEELAETIQAICKDRKNVRNSVSDNSSMQLAEEIADSFITLIQIIYQKGIQSEVMSQFDYKLDRQIDRIYQEEQDG